MQPRWRFNKKYGAFLTNVKLVLRLFTRVSLLVRDTDGAQKPAKIVIQCPTISFHLWLIHVSTKWFDSLIVDHLSNCNAIENGLTAPYCSVATLFNRVVNLTL